MYYSAPSSYLPTIRYNTLSIYTCILQREREMKNALFCTFSSRKRSIKALTTKALIFPSSSFRILNISLMLLYLLYYIFETVMCGNNIIYLYVWYALHKSKWAKRNKNVYKLIGDDASAKCIDY